MASVLLLASALLLAGTYRALQVDPGFDPTDVLTFRVTPPPATHADASAIDLFYTTLLERLGTLPQIASVGAMSNLPMAGNSTIRGVIRPGDPVPARGEEQYVLYQVSTPGYVAASGMQLLAGRDFTANDVAGSRPVALINESLARTLWPDGAAVGRQLLIFTDEDTPREVVGVLADIRYRGLDRAVLPQYFVPLSQGPTRSMSVAMRLDAPLDLADLRAVVESVDAALPVYDIRSLEELMRQSLSDRRALTTTMGLFGALAITLAAIGLHGIIATGVRERRREIGIRMAVGASTGQVRRLFLRQGLVLAATAVVLGLGVGTWILMSVDELTQGIDRPGPGLLAAVAAFVLVSALVATWLPTRVATRVDPVRTLRDGA